VSYYQSDLTDEQWEIIAPFVAYQGGSIGRPREINTRNVIDAILYVNKTGCQWRYLPEKFPHWKAVHKYFSLWRDKGIWQKINDALREKLREIDERNKEPSASIVDSQSVKTVQFGTQRGYDAGKKTKGRKRHIAVDTLGLLLMIVVHSASIQDRVGVKSLLIKMAAKYRRLKTIFADGGYTGKLIAWCFAMFHWTIQSKTQ